MPGLSSRPSVLLVDEHPANLVALEAVLRPLQMRWVMASSGEQTLQCLLLREDFAVIIRDALTRGSERSN